SDQTPAASIVGSESPMAFRATTLTLIAFDGPLPGVEMSHVVATQSVVESNTSAMLQVETRNPVIGELLKGPAFQRIVTTRSEKPLGKTLVTGPGLSCTDTRMVPHT